MKKPKMFWRCIGLYPPKQLLLAMKFTLIFTLVLTMSSFAGVRSQVISYSGKNVKMSDFFRAIKKQVNYDVISRTSDITNMRLNIDFKNEELGKALDIVFKQYGLEYMIDNKAIVVKKMVNEPTIERSRNTVKIEVFVQQNIAGKIINNQGFPIEGVTVSIKGKASVQSDKSGEFKIAAAIGDEISFRSVGYQSAVQTIRNLQTLTITLQEEVLDVDEVVVVGYGSVKKSDLTGSVSTINASQVRQVNTISNVAQALQGQAPGVQVNQASGQPGEGMKIQIRGLNSLGASNAPLYVVDGMPLDALSAQLNPEDIESISVLKDASSTAIYGSRGANGVIMISTKRGKSGKTKVSLNSYVGAQRLRKKIDLVNAEQFATLQNEVAANDGKPLPWTESQIHDFGEGTDWQDLVYKPALVHSQDLNLSGGNDNTRYFTSFGYFNQDGIIRNSGFERMSFRGNIEHDIFDKLTMTTNFSLQNSKYNRAQYESADGGGGIPWASVVMPPTVGVLDEDGNYTKFTGVPWGETNPVGISENWSNVSNNLRLIGNTSLAYEIVGGLKLRLSAGIDHGYNKGNLYYPATISLGQRSDANGSPIFGVASKTYGSTTTFVNENMVEFNKVIEKHKIDAVGGLTYQVSKGDDLSSGTGIGFLSDIYENNYISSAITKALPSTSFSNSKLISYLGRVNYGYSEKYLVTLTGRYDGSSRFGIKNKFAFFPSAAVAWVVSQEDFLEDSESLSLLKIRTSIGRSGNQAIGNYQTLANLSNTDVILDNQINTGFVLSALENSNLKWETTQQLDVGFDLGFFNNRLQIVADYYNKRTQDLLLNVTLPGSGGFSSVLQNVGVVRNRGFEFQVSAQPKLNENLAWNTSFNLSANRTKVMDLGNDAYGNPITFKEINTGGNWFPTIVGQSMMQLYGFTVEGVYETDQEAIDNGEPSKRAGDYRFKNWDGKGVINDTDDRTVLSRLEPKFTFGFNNRFEYKNFDFSFLIVGSYGNDIVNEFRKYNVSLNGNWAPTREAFDNRWTQGKIDAYFDQPGANSGSDIRDYANSLWVENGSYLRLRDVTLGYTLNGGWTEKIHLSNVRVYASAQNYLTITNYSGYDPEVSWASASVNGWDRGNYPSSKSLTFGIRVDF